MNKPRRKEIQKVIARIENLQAELEAITEAVNTLSAKEEECKDNMPENLQGSEEYERAETVCDALSSAVDSLELLDLDEIISYLNEAIEA